MTSYRLVNDGYSFKKIVSGRKWVGRVVKHATEPRYLGIIGKITVSAPTERAAFDEVCARALGFANLAALNAHNTRTAAANRAGRADARYVVGEMLAGNYDPMLDMLTKNIEKTPLPKAPW